MLRFALAAALASAAGALTVQPKPGSALLLRGGRQLRWEKAPELAPRAERHALRDDGTVRQSLVRLPARAAVAERALACDQSFVVLRGRLRVRAGGLERDLKAGDYAAIPPRVPHALEAATWWRAVVYSWVVVGDCN